MILDRPNCFVLVQIVLVESNLFWPCPIQFSGSSYISGLSNFLSFEPVQNELACPKRIGPVQNKLVPVQNALDAPK